MGGNPETLTNAAGVVVFEGTTSEGGGSQAGNLLVRKFAFTHATPGLFPGAAVFTPSADEIIYDGWVEIIEAFDDHAVTGTVPLIVWGPGQFGALNSTTLNAQPWDATAVDNTNGGTFSNSGVISAIENSAVYPVQNVNAPDNNGLRTVPARDLDGSMTIYVTVYDDNTGGDALPTVGSAILYVVTATPASFA